MGEWVAWGKEILFPFCVLSTASIAATFVADLYPKVSITLPIVFLSQNSCPALSVSLSCCWCWQILPHSAQNRQSYDALTSINNHRVRVCANIWTPFADPAQVVHRKGTGNLHQLLLAFTETFNRILRNSSDSSTYNLWQVPYLC